MAFSLYYRDLAWQFVVLPEDASHPSKAEVLLGTLQTQKPQFNDQAAPERLVCGTNHQAHEQRLS